jgi:hypothetical protein
LGCPTTRATFEEALRRAAAQAEHAQNERAAQQRRYRERLSRCVDVEVLVSREMWR